MALVLTTKTK